MGLVDIEIKQNEGVQQKNGTMKGLKSQAHDAENQAVQISGPGKELVMVQGTIPETPEHGVVVKVHCTGICHSDVHIWKNQIKISDQIIIGMEQLNPNFQWPFIPGHEIAGEIHAIGENHTEGDPELTMGDKVVVYPWVGCGSCEPCLHGESNLCPLSIAYDVGIGSPGGYQYYVAIKKKSNVVKIPDDISSEVACMFGCSALTPYNACSRVKKSIDRAVKITGEARLLVIGAGGLGLWAVQMAKALFPEGTKIYVADVGEDKLKQAKECGADETIFWDKDAEESLLVEKTKEVTGGIDASIDFVGLPATISRAFQAAKKGSTLAVVGLAGGTAQLPMVEMILKDITLTGIYVGNKETMQDLIQLYSEKKMIPPPLNHISLDEAPDALLKLSQGKVQGRSIIHFV